mgnify:CR=1 FL=1
MTIDELKKYVSTITEIKGDCVRIKVNEGYMLKLGDSYTDELFCERSAIPDNLIVVPYSTYLIESNKEKYKGMTVEEAKEKLVAEITAYDKSDKVNGFMLNGLLVWLDKATRVGLMNSTTIAKTAGQETTTLWLGDVKLIVGCDKAIQLLSALEMYALECFNVTAAHKKAVSELKTIKEVEAFDVTADYPKQLEMKL